MAAALLERLVELVAAQGMERELAEDIVYYLADRCATMSLATVHSSSATSMQGDAFLVERLGLERSQISAWIALLRGTRAVRRHDGEVAGGCPGFIEVAATDGSAETQLRFRRLAQRAAGGVALAAPSEKHVDVPARAYPSPADHPRARCRHGGWADQRRSHQAAKPACATAQPSSVGAGADAIHRRASSDGHPTAAGREHDPGALVQRARGSPAPRNVVGRRLRHRGREGPLDN